MTSEAKTLELTTPADPILNQAATAVESSGAAFSDYNFFYLATNYSWWTSGKSYVISFYAKASADAVRLCCGIRENSGSLTIESDNHIVIDSTWQRYEVVIAAGLSSTNGIRAPWFGLGLNDAAIDVYVSGIKIEYGFKATPLISARTIVGQASKRTVVADRWHNHRR